MPVFLTPEQQWARQWSHAAVALADVRARELQSMSDADALRITEELLALARPTDSRQGQRAWSCLVELQRLLHRSRRP